MRRIEVDKAREILRQHTELGLSQREIAASLGVSVGSVSGILTRARAAGIKYPLTLSSKELGSILYPPAEPDGKKKYAEPDLEYIHREMQKKGLTLQLLWEEYKSEHPDGYMYTQFCDRYRAFRKQNDVYMRKVYKAGERAMVDWAGLTMSYVDKYGEVHLAYIFTAVLPASGYLYVEPFRDMGERSWISAHTNMFEYIGGVPRIITPDNAKTSITTPNYYEPVENRTYADMARHYGTAIVPARTYRPRDKSPVEKGVQHIENRIIAKLRKRQFFCFDELCSAVNVELDVVNRADFKKIPGSRHSVFNEIEKPQLMPLPPYRYEHALWKQVKSGMDYHVEYDKRYYSIPFRYAGKDMEVRATVKTLEVFYEHERIASHLRNYSDIDRYTTLPEHMPSNHRAMADWTTGRFESWSRKFGDNTHRYICFLMQRRQHPEQAFKTCAGILRMGESVPSALMESVCAEALEKKIYSHKYFKVLFKRTNQANDEHMAGPIQHGNIRGSAYYGGDTDA
jgi:transposase